MMFLSHHTVVWGILRARLACKRLSIFVQWLTRLSYQRRPLSNLRCQPLDSQLSAVGRYFVGLTTPTKWRDLRTQCVFSLHYSKTLNIAKYLKVLKYKVNIFTIYNGH